MAVRPNFRDPVELDGAELRVAGTSADGAPPAGIQVFLEQGDRVASGVVDDPGPSWQAQLPAEGFAAGPALAFGVEVRTRPFETTTWSQLVEIR